MPTKPSLTSRLLLAAVAASRIKYRQFDPARFTGDRAKPRDPRAFLPPAKLRGVEVERVERHGWPTFDVRPAGSDQAPSVMYLHGGAHAAEIQSGHWQYVARLAVASHRTITVPIYPLAPEHTYRDVEPTLVAIYRDLAAGGVSPVVMGDSAWANLSLALVQALPVTVAAPELVILLSGSGDATLSHPDIAVTAKADPLLHPEHLRDLFQLYAADLPLRDPRISPINGNLNRFARVVMYNGTRDILIHDDRQLRDRLLHAGADVVYEEYEGMPHDWMLMPIPEARRQLTHLVGILDAAPPSSREPLEARD